MEKLQDLLNTSYFKKMQAKTALKAFTDYYTKSEYQIENKLQIAKIDAKKK